MLLLQVLLVVSYGRSLPPNFANFGGEFPGASTDPNKRRELFLDDLGNALSDAGNYVTSGQIVDDAEQVGAWAASTGEDALHATHHGINVAVNEIDQKATEFSNHVEAAVHAGIAEFEKIPFEDVMEQIDAVLKKMCLIHSVDSCLTDISARGCMPGDGECVITYGHGCLRMEYDWGGHVEGELTTSRSQRGVDLQAGLSMYGGATASISTAAVVELHIDSTPSIRVLIDPPTVTLDAKVEIEASFSLTAQAEEKRIELSRPHTILKRVFMAGFIPVMIAVRAQPVAYISASGELRGTGKIIYAAKGTIGFSDDLWLELNLDTFNAVQNFDTITAPSIDFEEGWELNLEANVDLQLTAKLGLELSVSLYDVVEVNMLPMVVARVSANGRISASATGNMNGVSSLSAEASGLAELCLSGDFKGYLDWVDLQGNRGSKRGRRELLVAGGVNEQGKEMGGFGGFGGRRDLGSTINIKQAIVNTCRDAAEALAPDCDPAKEVLRSFCGLAGEGLDLLGFPTSINVPSIDGLRLPALDLPQTCFTMSLDWEGKMDFNQAQENGIQCGGHFHGSTVGLENNHGNAAGDAWHTFVAGDSNMIIDACQSKYDSFIRLYKYERYYERKCVNLFFDEVCFDWPRSRWDEISHNDDHSGRCHNPGHGYASFLQVHNLVAGDTYALVVEGYGSNEGQYSVSLSCPSLEASLQTAEPNCVDITLHTKAWGNEVSWSITGAATCFGNSYGNYGEYRVNDCCLTSGQSFNLNCQDSYGDGWHTGYIEINGKKYCETFLSGPIRSLNNIIV